MRGRESGPLTVLALLIAAAPAVAAPGEEDLERLRKIIRAPNVPGFSFRVGFTVTDTDPKAQHQNNTCI